MNMRVVLVWYGAQTAFMLGSTLSKLSSQNCDQLYFGPGCASFTALTQSWIKVAIFFCSDLQKCVLTLQRGLQEETVVSEAPKSIDGLPGQRCDVPG